jgi:hypothetical protein
MIEETNMALTERDLERIGQLLATRRGVLVDRQERVQHDLARRNDPLVPDSSDRAIQLENDETLQAIDEVAHELRIRSELQTTPARINDINNAP